MPNQVTVKLETKKKIMLLMEKTAYSAEYRLPNITEASLILSLTKDLTSQHFSPLPVDIKSTIH